MAITFDVWLTKDKSFKINNSVQSLILIKDKLQKIFKTDLESWSKDSIPLLKLDKISIKWEDKKVESFERFKLSDFYIKEAYQTS